MVLFMLPNAVVAPFIACIICSFVRYVCRVRYQPRSLVSQRVAYLETQRDLLQLATHAVELLDIPKPASVLHPRLYAQATLPPGPDKILCLDLGSTHLSLLRMLPDCSDQGLLLLLQLHPLLIEFANRLIEKTLILSKALRRRHALAEGPFEDLGCKLAGGIGATDMRSLRS